MSSFRKFLGQLPSKPAHLPADLLGAAMSSWKVRSLARAFATEGSAAVTSLGPSPVGAA